MRGAAKNVFLLIILAMFSLIFTNQAVFATTISVSIPDDTVYIAPLPGVLSTASQTIIASTDNPTGYRIELNNTSSSSALINQIDSSLTIPTFVSASQSTNIPASSLGYGYGYSVDNGTNFYAMPEPSAQPARLFTTNTAGSNNHTLTFGAKVSPETAAGVYSITFTVQAVANLATCPNGNICYDGNGDDGTGTMSNQPASSNTSTVLMPSNFSRAGYGFVGWNTQMDGSGTDYGPSETVTTGDLSNTGMQLYAKWVQSSGDFQTWSGCDAMTAATYNSSTGRIVIAGNSITALTDTRDGSTYAVVKLPDENCWMMENLRLDLHNPDLEITSTNTNRPTSSFAQYIEDNHPASSNNFCANNNAACVDQVYHNTNNTNRTLTASYDANNTTSSWYSYGHYYNWYTLTAGNGTYNLNVAGAAANGDICPTKWRLPTGYGNTGDFAVLDKAIGGNGISQSSGATGVAGSLRWRNFPMNYIYSGEQKGNTAANRSISASNATLNASSYDRTINVWLKADGMSMNSNTTPKVRGQTVRCVFNTGYHVEGNIHYDANGGTGTIPDETSVNFAVATAASNTFTKDYYLFSGWNTKADGTGVVVSEGGSVSNAANVMEITEGETLTLYAIWRPNYILAYDGNNADDGNMTTANTEGLGAGTKTLAASNFARAGYGFAGWSLDSNAGSKLLSGQSVTVYGPNQTITIDNAFLANADQTNRISMYAVWLPEDSNYTMQTFGTGECSAMSSGSVIALKDIRDNNVYSVAKLEDGNCWMTENLRLNPRITAFSNSNTNSPTADFISNAPSSDTNNTLCNTNDSGCIDSISYNTNNINLSLPASIQDNNINMSWYSYGVMYNWYTATAGNGGTGVTSGSVTADICPAGWRLPTGGTGGEFATLNTQANSGSTATDAGLRKFPDNFIYSGDYNNKKPGGRGSYGRYWSSTANGVNNAYRLGIVSSGATPLGSYGKWDAFAIRCIVK